MKPKNKPPGTGAVAPHDKPLKQPWWHGVAVVPKADSVKNNLVTEWHVLVFTSGQVDGAIPHGLNSYAGDHCIIVS